jgi:hypothetical protein
MLSEHRAPPEAVTGMSPPLATTRILRRSRPLSVFSNRKRFVVIDAYPSLLLLEIQPRLRFPDKSLRVRIGHKPVRALSLPSVRRGKLLNEVRLERGSTRIVRNASAELCRELNVPRLRLRVQQATAIGSASIMTS